MSTQIVLLSHSAAGVGVRLIHADHPDLPVIMVSASTAIPSVVEAIRLGAVDFVGKPFDIENLRHIVRRVVETRRLHR